jgi:ATP-dependent Clp protease ATP-binding subunit ClpC
MMFERYTEAARRTLFFARYEASELGGASIGTEHLLIGLLRETGPLVGRILAEAEVSYTGVRKDMEELTADRSKLPTSVEMPFSEETQRVLVHAEEEANRLGHRYIGPEHLLLGLLREHGTAAERRLAQKGLSIDRVRTLIGEQRESS